MRFLLTGSGSIGRRHLANLRHLYPRARIDLLSSRGRAIETPPEATRVVSSVDESLREGLDAAVVASPAPFHVATCRTLLDAAVPVLVEKPLSDTLCGVDDLLATARSRNRILMVGYTLRFHPAVRRLAEAVQGRAIGRILAARFEVGQYLPDWRPASDYRETVSARRELGGGALLELSHEIDYAQLLLGPIAQVSALIGRVGPLEIDVDDCVDLTVRFAGGAQGTIHLDLLARSAYRGCRLVGTDGTLEWNGSAQEVRQFDAGRKEWTVLASTATTDRNEMYLSQLRHFLKSVETGADPLETAAGARSTLQVIEAARLSAAEGRIWEVER